MSNHKPLQSSSKTLLFKRILNTRKEQVIWLTTHSPPQHRTRPAEKKGLLGLQWVAVSYNEFRCKLKRIHGFLIESPIQPVCDCLQSFKEPSLVFQFQCIIPFIRQWHTSWDINRKHKKHTDFTVSTSSVPWSISRVQHSSLPVGSGKQAMRTMLSMNMRLWSFHPGRKSVMKWGYECLQKTVICISSRLCELKAKFYWRN